MAKANVDPAELRRFAKDLSRFNSELQGLMTGINSKMRQLERSWKDQEQRKFAEEFTRTMKALAQFSESAEQHASALQKRAGYIEEYLRQR